MELNAVISPGGGVVLIGDLEVEVLASDEPGHDVEGGAQTWYRPLGVPLINDRPWHFWMMSGESYRLEYDGTGWKVAGQTWPGGQPYRLGDADGRPVTTLPLAGRELALDGRKSYAIQEIEWHRWGVFDTTG